MAEDEHQEWTTAFINNLPDAAFAVIQPGGEKDEEGKTVPRTLRKLPHHNQTVADPDDNASVDLPHLRNALARLSQTDLTDEQMTRARNHLTRHAEKLLGETGQTNTGVSVFQMEYDGWKPEVVWKGDKMIVMGARIFRANTPMKGGLIYTPEELDNAVEDSLLFDIDHNYLAIGEDDKLLRAYMDSDRDFLLGDLQFATATLQMLIQSHALNGVSVVTHWESIENRDGQKFAHGVSIDAISLTMVPFCGKGGAVEGCGITHTANSNQSNNTEDGGHQCACGDTLKECCKNAGGPFNAIGGDSLSNSEKEIEELKDKVSELTKERDRLKGELETAKSEGHVNLEDPKVQEHVKTEITKAIDAIDLAGKFEEAFTKISEGTTGDELTALKEKFDEFKKAAVDEYVKAEDAKAVDAKKKELLDEYKDDKPTKKVIEGLDTMEGLEAFEKSASSSAHRLNVEGDSKAAEMKKLKQEFNAKLGKPLKNTTEV